MDFVFLGMKFIFRFFGRIGGSRLGEVRQNFICHFLFPHPNFNRNEDILSKSVGRLKFLARWRIGFYVPRKIVSIIPSLPQIRKFFQRSAELHLRKVKLEIAPGKIRNGIAGVNPEKIKNTQREQTETSQTFRFHVIQSNQPGPGYNTRHLCSNGKFSTPTKNNFKIFPLILNEIAAPLSITSGTEFAVRLRFGREVLLVMKLEQRETLASLHFCAFW